MSGKETVCASELCAIASEKDCEGRGSGKKKKCELGKLKLTKTDHFVEVAVCVSVCVKTSRKPRESMLRS